MSARLKQPRFGLDFAWSQPSDGAFHSIGALFGVGYLSYDQSKNLTRQKVQELQAGHIDVAAVWETSANRSLDGHDAGVSDAKEAARQAADCGKPALRPIYFAVDFDTAGNPGQTDAYFDGVRAVLGDLCGPYGGVEVVNHQFNRGLKWGWQTLAWSGGRWDSRAQIQQYSVSGVVDGIGVDLDRAMFADFGQWFYQPPAADLHYERYPEGPFIWNHHGNRRPVNEREIVRLYDRLRERPHLHEYRLNELRRNELLYLRKRCFWVAHHDHEGRPLKDASWGDGEDPNWHLWRWERLLERTRGGAVKD